MVQCLRFHSPSAGELGLIPGQRTRAHILQLKIQCATKKTQCGQINKLFLIFKKSSNSNVYMYTLLLYIIKCFYVLVRMPPRKMLKTIHMLDVVSLGLPQGSSG